MSEEFVNTTESLEAASGSMEDFAAAADLVGEVAKAETNGSALGAILMYRKKVREQAIAECRAAPIAAQLDQDAERAAFEAWHCGKFKTKHSTGHPTRDMHNGIYAKNYGPEKQQQMWEAWQAARAAPAAQLDAELPPLPPSKAHPVMYLSHETVYSAEEVEQIRRAAVAQHVERIRQLESALRGANRLLCDEIVQALGGDGRTAGTAPEGWKLVPSESTMEMDDAGHNALLGRGANVEVHDAEACWSSMIAAAPSPGKEDAKP